MTRTLVTPGTDADLIGLELADLGAGESLERRFEQETVVVVLSGVAEASADGTSLGRAGGRTTVFDGPGHAVYAPPGTQLRLTAQGNAELAIATAPLDGRPPALARIIPPADQRMAEVGKGNWGRSVRTILGPEHAAGRILIGETINPPGNWSSYPPHKHDVQDRPGGFGVQLRYDADTTEALSVRDHDVAVIRSGYHPVVAAPGYALYYLWIMAGDGRQMIPYMDPAHAWVAES